MRTKTRLPTPRNFTARHNPSSTTALRALPTLDEDNDHIIDRIAPETSSENDDTNVVDGKVKRRRHLDDGRDAVDWLGQMACLLCSRGSDGRETLLVCSEMGCPVAFHEKCLQFKPKFDDLGRFYCPYCWYKRNAQGIKQLRKKKGFLGFVGAKDKGNDSVVIPPDQQRDCREHSDGAKSVAEVENGGAQVEGSHGSERERVVGGKGGCDHLEGKAQTVEATEGSSIKEKMGEENGSEKEGFETLVDEGGMAEEGERISEEVQFVEPLSICYVEEGHKEEKEEEEEKIHKNESDEENRDTWEKKQIREDEPETTLLSSRGDATPKMPEISDSDAETFVVRQRQGKHSWKNKTPHPCDADSPMKSSPQLRTTSEKKSGKRKKGVSPHKLSKQLQKSAKKITRRKVSNEKRKRVHWTSEEEEILKDGVNKFSTTANKNMPWTKILEFGHHVFDSTRTAIDLKDKWRNIMAKESSDINCRFP